VANPAIDPIEGVQGSSGSKSAQAQNSLDALHNDAVNQERWITVLKEKHAATTYSCYMLVIQVINHISLDKIDGQVIAESNTMNIETEMQQNMIKVSKMLSSIQGQTAGTLPYVSFNPQSIMLSPNSLLGLKESYYHVDPQTGVEDAGSGKGSFQETVKEGVEAFRKLFYCNTDSNAPTVGSLNTIKNPNVYQNGQDFNVSGYWSQLSAKYAPYSRTESGQQFNVVGSNPSDHASLIQQYMYAKMQAAVLGGNIDTVDSAQGDISKLINFDPKGSGDDFITQSMQVINAFNVQEQASISGVGNPVSYINPVSGNILDLMLKEQYTDYDPSGVSPGNDHWQQDPSQDQSGGLYNAFNNMAFNHFWAQANSGKASQHIPNDAQAPSGSLSGWYEADINSVRGVSSDDNLSSSYTTVNGCVTSLGTVTSTEGTKMQELTSNEGNVVNIGQTSLKGLKDAVEAYSANQLSS
jgi:hypothetical protein